MATALVTGGTSGIGAAFTRALAARGDDLVLVARNAERLAETAMKIKDHYGVEVEVIAADLAVREEVLGVAERLRSTEQPIDTLVNNAGFAMRVSLVADDLSPHEHAVDVMIRAVLLLGGAAGATMKARGGGTIINVSSTAGFLAMSGYSAIKAWVTSYSEALSNELKRHDVSVTALCPGWVRTEFHQRADIAMSKVPSLMYLDADKLVADCLHDAAQRKVISIPSMRYKAMMILVRVAPRGIVRNVSARISSGHRD